MYIYSSSDGGGCGGVQSGVSASTDNGFGLHPAKMNYSTLDDCGRADGRPCRGGTLKTPEAG